MSAINKRAQQVTGEIISNKRAGAYHHLVITVGDIAALIRPGNFVAVAVGGADTKMVLRRAFAIYKSGIDPIDGGIIELVVAPHGSGSTWLTSAPLHTKLDIILPLGTSFGIPVEPVRALLVGGGYGSAPLFGLAEALRAKQCTIDMVLGASTASKIYAPQEAKRSVQSMLFTTDDGSLGIQGMVSDVIPEIIEKNKIDIIYSCGPMAMLESVTTIASQYGLQHQCAVEESMACGIGVCMTCVLPVRGSDGVARMVRTCIDGPVMEGSDVLWNSGRTIPSEVWGAI